MQQVTQQGYRAGRRTLDAVSRSLAALQRVAFWSVLVLPVLYTALFVSGLAPVTIESLAVAFSAHALALVVGHGHATERSVRS